MWIRRSLIIGAAMCLALFAAHDRASAQVEFCPAAVTMAPVASQAGAYSVILSAGSQRSVWGTIVAKTTAGWFWIPFNNLQLTLTTEQYKTDFSQFQRSVFVSPTSFVRLPSNARVLYAYVNSGRAEGDAEYGWLGKGLVSCQSAEDRRVLGGPSAQTVTDVATLQTAPALPTTISPGAMMLTAKSGEPPGPTNCATPFADASTTRVVVPLYPINGHLRNARVIVAVAVDAAGKLLDAWTWGSSGERAFDAVAVSAARNSAFSPKRAFCQDVPSLNYLVMDFHVH